MLQLKQIVSGVDNEEKQLKLIKQFESENSMAKFDILTKIRDLLSLASSLLAIKQIITVFVRKLISLLDELDVLESTELSQEGLDGLKRFWSLCSSQQNVISSSMMFGKWDPSLVEALTPLVSIFVDLSIVAHQDKENRSLWSKKLYSWLSFDLPDRVIKVALLEVTGHTKDGADIVAPLVSKVLSRHFDENSNPEYLLHFVLLKKWQGMKSVSDLVDMSKTLKAPESFLEWLKTYWNIASDYIPDDKSLKGARVSQFLLDLDTDDVLESLIDVLQMAIFPEASQNGESNGHVVSDTPLFVVDKKGKSKDKKPSHQKESLEPVIKSGQKRKGREMLDSEVEKMEVSPSPKSKKQKINDAGDNALGFVLDRGSAKPDVTVIDDDEEKDENEEDGLIGSDLMLEESIEIDDDDENDKDSNLEEDVVNSVELSDNRGDDSDGSDIIEIQETKNSSPKSANLAAAVLKKKQILIMDPVASSYFTSGKGKQGGDILVFESTDEEDDKVKEGIDSSGTKTKESPKKIQANGKNVGESPRKTKRSNDHIQEISKSITSHFKTSDNEIDEPLLVDIDCKNSEKVEEKKDVTVNMIHSVTVDGDGQQSIAGSVKSIEEDIASKLTMLRKSTPSKIGVRPLTQSEKETPSRRSTRLRMQSDKDEPTPTKKLNSSASLLKNWLRSPSAAVEDDSDGDREKPSRKHSMTKIKEHDVSKASIPHEEKETKESENISPAKKDIRSRRSAQYKDKSEPTPKKSDSSASRTPSKKSSGDNDNDSDSSVNLASEIVSPMKKSATKSRKDSQSSSPEKKSKILKKNDNSDHLEKSEGSAKKNSPKMELTKSDVFPNSPVKTYLKRDRKPSEKVLMNTPKSLKATPGLPSNKSLDKDIEQDSKDIEEDENEQEKKSPKNRQRRKSEPVRSAAKSKVALTTMTPGRKVSKEIQSNDSVTSTKTAGKSQATKASSDDDETKQNLTKTPVKRSRNLSSKTPTSQSGKISKKSPGPSPVNRRKSLRSAKLTSIS